MNPVGSTVRMLPPEDCEHGGGANGDAAAVEGFGRVDVHETNCVILNAMNEGIRSLQAVDFPAYGIARPSTLLSLSLHSNRVSSLEGLDSMTALTALNLSSNELGGSAIRSCAPHLGALSALESLDLSCNQIDALLGLPFLPRLSRLIVPYNRLASLDGVQVLASSLTYLDVRDNRISGPTDTHAPHLAALGRLKSLLLVSPGGGQPNPICASHDYRRDFFAAAPSLETLDGTTAGALQTTTAAVATAAASASVVVVRSARVEEKARRVDNAATVGTGIQRNIARNPPPLDRNGLFYPADRGHTQNNSGFRGVLLQGNQVEMETVIAPEEVPMPRFNALANRFRRLRGVQAPGGGLDEKEASEDGNIRLSGRASSTSLADGSVCDSWGEGGDERRRGAYSFDKPIDFGRRTVHPEETVGRTSMGRSSGRERDGQGWDGKSSVCFADGELLGSVRGEDVAEEQGLLSRLRSVAQEARLEVMDSRLQDLHEKQVKGVAGARRATVAAAAATAESAGSGGDSVIGAARRQQGNASRLSAAHTSRGNNPWGQQISAAKTGVVRSSRTVASIVGPRAVHTAGSRPIRPKNVFKDAGVGGVSYNIAAGNEEMVGGDGPFTNDSGGSLVYFEEEVGAGCPCCAGLKDEPKLTLTADRRKARARAAVEVQGVLAGGLTGWNSSRCTLESSVPKPLSDASAPANGGPAAANLPLRSSGKAHTQRVASGNPKQVFNPAWGVSAMSVRKAVAAAAVVGAVTGSMSGFDNRRLAVCFLRWARDTDRAKATANATAAETALAVAREEAQRERQAWESLRSALEGSAATREREAQEAAEEKGREELRSMAAERRSADETASDLQRRLAQAEADTIAAMHREQQAQAARQQAQVEAARVKADAEAVAQVEDARANARADRLEEQLRAKGQAESEVDEECRRVRALLREAESRSRGLMDQVEESRARERRMSADAEDARRREMMEADNTLANAVATERERVSALKHKLEESEAEARAARSAAKGAVEREARGRRAAIELAELARQQKAALQLVRSEVGAARAEKNRSREAMKEMCAGAARTATEMKELRDTLGARECELTAECRARWQQEEATKEEKGRAEALDQERNDLDARLIASASAQGDLRMALMVKDKVLEDREKLIQELRLREEDALAEAQSWRDRLEMQQSEADHQLDAAREEVSELQAQVVALSGVEDQLRDVFKELRRYRRRYADDDSSDGYHVGGGVSSRDKDRERDGKDKGRGTGLAAAVASVTAAAKAVEEELRAQLEAKDQALRYVENELLGMKSLFESKEASLRQELGEERNTLAREAEELKRKAAQAAAGRTAAEESAREQTSVVDTLHANLRNGSLRSKELEDALRALLVKYEDEKRKTAQKLSKMATIFNQLQNQEEDQVQISVAPLHRALSAPKSNRSMRHSSSPSETGR